MTQVKDARTLPTLSTAGGCCGKPAATVDPPQEIKEQVRRHYGAAVTQRSGSCCSSSATATPSITALAGYREEELATLPPDAVASSFGCGDPLAMSGVQPGETVLDLGSGAGMDCFIAASKVGPAGRVIGLDMTPEMLAAARRNAEQGGYTNVEFREGEAENMPVDDASVDWVISNCVINLSPDKPRVFREIQRVLKPGGHIAISDIVAEGLPEFVRQDPGAYCGCIGGAIPEEEYLRGLTQAGLIEVATSARLDYTPEMIWDAILGDEDLRARYGAVINARPELLRDLRIASIKVTGRKPRPEEEVQITVRPARPADLAAAQNLLATCHLPDAGLQGALANAVIAEHGGHLLGMFAMERYGDQALLRSFAVAPAWRGRGVGTQLWQELMARTRQRGIRDYYLLTSTIVERAARAGFEPIPREQVPAVVQAATEFQLQQCAGATVMRLRRPAK